MALYSPGQSRWAMTERGARRLARSEEALVIGASTMRQVGGAIEFTLDERGAPLPRAVRGHISVVPVVPGGEPIELSHQGQHFWQPLAPVARVKVAFERPAIHWEGTAYLDTNWGAAPLEQAFVGWDWSRAVHPEGATVLYDIERRDQPPLELALSFGNSAKPGTAPRQSLPRTGWGLRPRVRCDAGYTPQAVPLEDTPFYSRALVHAQQAGQPVTLMHESLSLDRFRSGWVQALLGFRMPRIA